MAKRKAWHGAAEEAVLIGRGLALLNRPTHAGSPALHLIMECLSLAQAISSTDEQPAIRPIQIGFRSTNRSDMTKVHNASKASFAAIWQSTAATGTTADRWSAALASLVHSRPAS